MSKAPALDYALQIIELFAKSNKDLGITDIGSSLSVNKNAVLRMIEGKSPKKSQTNSDLAMGV